MRTFNLRIATLDKTLLDGDVVHCRIRTANGSIGLEARHEPFLAALAPESTVEVRNEGGEVSSFPVSEGMLSFAGNRCLILLGPHA